MPKGVYKRNKPIKPKSKEWRMKISEGLKARAKKVGYKHTCEICGKRLKNNNLKANRCMKHRVFTEKHRKNLSKAITGTKNPKGSLAKMGSKNPGWEGGKSFEPYTVDWTETLRRSIRERDHYTCQSYLCDTFTFGKEVHHIDYDKKNCDPNNLITLCNICHGKTNRNREKWTKYFYKLRGPDV